MELPSIVRKFIKGNRAALNLKIHPLVSIIIVTCAYDSRKDIDDCLKSIENQTYKNFEVIIVDTMSSGGTRDYVERSYPFVKLVRSKADLGYSGGNALGVKYTYGKYIVVSNPDVVVDKDWLYELIRGARNHPEAGILAPNVLLYDKPRMVNACGVEVHFTGLVFPRFFEEPESRCKEEYVLAPCGASFMIRRDVVEDVGFMDQDFFMDFGDIDLAMRVLLRGWKCLIVPSSKVYHKFLLKMTPRKYFILERGRWLMSMKNFSRRTLIILLPSLALTEVLAWGYALYCGKEYVASKIATYRWVLKNLTKTLKKRGKVQKLRKVRDKELLELMSHKITVPKQWLEGISKLIVEGYFNAFYQTLYKIAHHLT